MKLLLYEMKKYFFKKSILICILIFSIINLYKVWSMYDIYMGNNYFSIASETMQNGYRKVYEDKLKGQITEDKIKFVRDYYEDTAKTVATPDFSKEYDDSRYTGYVYGDYWLFMQGILPDMSYTYMYGSNIQNIVDRAKENIDFFNEVDNKYEVKVNEKILNNYKNRYIPEFHMNFGIEYYFIYDFSALLIILLIVLGLSRVFCNEHETGMIQLIGSSPNKNKTIKMKFFASYIYILFVALYFYLLDFIAIDKIAGIYDLSNPIYTLQFFKETPLNMSIFSYLILDFVLKCIVFLFIGEIVLIFSFNFKRVIPVFFLSILSISALIFLNDFFTSVLNPVSLITNYELLKTFQCYNFFGIPVFKYKVYVLVTFIWCIILGLIIKRRSVKW